MDFAAGMATATRSFHLSGPPVVPYNMIASALCHVAMVHLRLSFVRREHDDKLTTASKIPVCVRDSHSI